jgi:hypothetical protein
MSIMLLSPEDADLFFKLHRSFMCFVNERLQIVPGIGTPNQYSALPPETRSEVHNAFLNNTDLIESFVAANPFGLSEEELAIVSSWRHLVADKFFIFRYLKEYAVFLATKEPPIAYGVIAISDPFEEMVGPHLPLWAETVLLPFKDKIVYDGLLSSYNISFGGGIKRSLNESYKTAKKRLGIVTQLPVDTRPLPATKPSRKAKKKAVPSSKYNLREVLAAIVGMMDQFCRDHLNEEYAALCRKLAEKLARKRPSPLLQGRPNAWACGIVRTIGMVNFLGDRSQQPHMKMTAIDKAFGVGESTGQGKSKQICRMFEIRQFSPNWTLPSRLDDCPMAWTLEVDGFIRDIRQCSREIQELAFEKGQIPYIPADRE